jgi:hypothetical protein
MAKAVPEGVASVVAEVVALASKAAKAAPATSKLTAVETMDFLMT